MKTHSSKLTFIAGIILALAFSGCTLPSDEPDVTIRNSTGEGPLRIRLKLPNDNEYSIYNNYFVGQNSPGVSVLNNSSATIILRNPISKYSRYDIRLRTELNSYDENFRSFSKNNSTVKEGGTVTFTSSDMDPRIRFENNSVSSGFSSVRYRRAGTSNWSSLSLYVDGSSLRSLSTGNSVTRHIDVIVETGSWDFSAGGINHFNVQVIKGMTTTVSF